VSLQVTIQDFIHRWQASAGAERANYQLFLTELCDQLGVPRPDPSNLYRDDTAYSFERKVIFQNPDGTTSAGFIDLYKRGCFVLEAKQGSNRPEQGAGLFDAAPAAPAQAKSRRAPTRGTRR
jgi:hypothetical protein